MDYKELLIKYIQHVRDCEGIDFISQYGHSDVVFTDEEWNELNKLSEQK